jgi:hypothetical protein
MTVLEAFDDSQAAVLECKKREINAVEVNEAHDPPRDGAEDG